MKFTFKVWSEIDGNPLMGPGRCRLLSALQKTGSINAAAKELGISYRRAWAQIRQMEQLLGEPLVVCNRGGSAGGGTYLTPAAVKLMERYRKVSKSVAKVAEQSGAISAGEPHVKEDAEIVRFREMVDEEAKAYAQVWQIMAQACADERCPLLPALRELSNLRYSILAKKAASLEVDVAELKCILPPSQ